MKPQSNRSANPQRPSRLADKIRLGLEQALVFAERAPETLGPNSPLQDQVSAETAGLGATRDRSSRQDVVG